MELSPNCGRIVKRLSCFRARKQQEVIQGHKLNCGILSYKRIGPGLDSQLEYDGLENAGTDLPRHAIVYWLISTPPRSGFHR